MGFAIEVEAANLFDRLEVGQSLETEVMTGGTLTRVLITKRQGSPCQWCIGTGEEGFNGDACQSCYGAGVVGDKEVVPIPD